MNLGILAYHVKVKLLDKGHDSESNLSREISIFNLKFLTDKC
jgi:hypothetical protein